MTLSFSLHGQEYAIKSSATLKGLGLNAHITGTSRKKKRKKKIYIYISRILSPNCSPHLKTMLVKLETFN